jgi:hypothetical protein
VAYQKRGGKGIYISIVLVHIICGWISAAGGIPWIKSFVWGGKIREKEKPTF